MGYTNSRATTKCWDPHINELKYCSYAKFDEHNNKFGRGWSPGYSLMNVKNIPAFLTLTFYLSDLPFIKDDIFEAAVSCPPKGTLIGIVAQYCKHHNMPYVYQPENNSPCTQTLPARNITNLCILIIGVNDPTTVQQVIESISSQNMTGLCNRIHSITAHRDNNILKYISKETNLYSIKLETLNQ